MKNILTLILVVLGMTVFAQTEPKKPVINTVYDFNAGIFRERQDEKINQMYMDKEGKYYTIYKTAKGKFYILTGKVSKTTGKPTRKYLII